MGLQLSRQSLYGFRPEDIKIGELLVLAGIVKQSQLLQTLSVQNSRLPIGQQLVMQGALTPHALQSAVDAQSLIKDGAVHIDLAVECLKTACRTGKELSNILDEFQSSTAATNMLGQLLLDAGLISQQQLIQSIHASRTTGLPLGRVLGIKQLITGAVLAAALELQQRLRDSMIDREQAIQSLRTAAGIETATGQKTTEETTHAPQPADVVRCVASRNAPSMRLGELLVASGVLSTDDVMSAVELALGSSKPFGHALIEQGFVSQATLDFTLELQKAVLNGTVRLQDATRLLEQVHSEKIQPAQAVAQAMEAKVQLPSPVSFQEFLFLCGTITEGDLEQATNFGNANKQLLSILLMAQGLVDQQTMSKLELCYELLAHGLLVEDEAVALHNILTRDCDSQLSLEAAIVRIRSMRDSTQTSPAPEVAKKQAFSALVSKNSVWDRHELAPWLKNIQEQTIPPGSTAFCPDSIKSINPITTTNSQAKRQQNGSRTGSITLSELESVCLNAADQTNKFAPADPRADSITRSGLLWQSFVRTAESYSRRGQYDKAQQYYAYVVQYKQRELGEDHPELIDDLGDMASILCLQGKLSEAELTVRRILSILLKLDNPDQLKLADTWSALGRIYFHMGDFDHSEQAILHALQLRKEQLGEKHPAVAKDLRDYARILRKLNFFARADNVYAHARALLSNAEAAEVFGLKQDDDMIAGPAKRIICLLCLKGAAHLVSGTGLRETAVPVHDHGSRDP